MKNKLRIIALILAVCSLISILASCKKDEAEEQTTDTAETVADTQTEENKLTEILLIRPQVVSNEIRDLFVSIRDTLKEETGLDVKLTSDYEAYEAKEGRYYVLLGKTEYELSKELVAAVADNEMRYKATEDCVAVYAKNDQLLKIALEKLFGDALKDGSFSVGEEYADLTVDGSRFIRDKWTLSVPAYSYGTLDEKTYSAGYGLQLDKNCSYMQVATETSPEDFSKYLSGLEELGYKKQFTNSVDGNLYASYTSVLGTNVYAYFMLHESKVRIIDDKASVTLDEFNYTVEANGSSRFYMFQMNTTSEDTFLIHLADNSWIVIDGGTTQHENTDKDGVYVDEMFNFMAQKSGLGATDKLVVSCWYMTHAHRDHLLGFKGLIDRYHARIDLQRVLSNTPDTEVVYNSNNPSYVECVGLINKYYKNVLYLKAHTGMTVRLADAVLDVVYTQEDNIERWCATEQNLNYKIYDYNNSSLCTRISVAGISVLELGDNFCTKWLLQPYYSINTLAADILKIGHHHYNPESDDFYKALHATGKVEYAINMHTTNPTSSTGKEVKALFGSKYINGSLDKTFEFYRGTDGKIVMNTLSA